MAQRQLPGGAFLNESGASKQTQLPTGQFVSEAAGANSYDVSVSESASASDSVASSLEAGATISETGSAADAVSAGSVVRSAAFAESINAGDSVSGNREVGYVAPAAFVPRGQGRARLLLTDPLPLALTTQLGGFAEAQPLAQRYGDLRRTRFKLQRMTSTKFIAAGHAMKDINRAFVGDLETKSFDWRVESVDEVIFTVVEFGAPVPVGTECSASGLGKMHEVSGALIENPADVMADLLLLAGRTDPWFSQLRSEASASGIVVAGSFTNIVPIRDAISAVADSCGAIWCPGMARLYPAPFTANSFKIDLDRFTAHGMTVTASDVDIADGLRIAFDYDEVEGRNQSFLQIEASPERFGGKIADLEMPMARSASIVEATGRRLLPRYAGKRYDVSFTTRLTEFVRPGTWAALTDHPTWPIPDVAPMLMLTSTTLDTQNRRADVVAEAITTTPVATVTKHSLGSNSIGAGGVEVNVRNGVAYFTIYDDQGKPFSGVYASLDGEPPKKTDASGQVSFVVTQSGEHTLDLSAEGYLPKSLIVTL